MFAFSLALVVSYLVTMWVVVYDATHARLTHDAARGGPQKFHARPVPRIGGVAVLVGVLGSLTVLSIARDAFGWAPLMLLLCAIPAFGAGIAEDITKRVSPALRLIATGVSALAAYALLDAAVVRTGIPGLDWVATTGAGSLAFTVLCVVGISHSVNIIDGFNGLASMCVLIMLGGLALIAQNVGDTMIVMMALAGIGAILGFFVWNFPNGRIFLGDGGAYFLGFYFAELALLLLIRNPTVSPLAPLLLCIYPVYETVFSIYRRKILRGRPMSEPDGAHLHSLIFRRFLRWAAGERTAREMTRRNSMTSPALWGLCLSSTIPAVLFWDSTPLVAGFVVLFCVIYSVLYWRIVRFKAPQWLVWRRRN